jgi:hypothetical protein
LVTTNTSRKAFYILAHHFAPKGKLDLSELDSLNSQQLMEKSFATFEGIFRIPPI